LQGTLHEDGLVSRVSEWPGEKQPFWFKNRDAINKQRYTQVDSSIQFPQPNWNQNFRPGFAGNSRPGNSDFRQQSWNQNRIPVNENRRGESPITPIDINNSGMRTYENAPSRHHQQNVQKFEEDRQIRREEETRQHNQRPIRPIDINNSGMRTYNSQRQKIRNGGQQQTTSQGLLSETNRGQQQQTTNQGLLSDTNRGQEINPLRDLFKQQERENERRGKLEEQLAIREQTPQKQTEHEQAPFQPFF